MRIDYAQLTNKGLICLTVEVLPLSPMERAFLCKMLSFLLLIFTNDIHQCEVLLGHCVCRVLPFLLVKRTHNYSVLPHCLLHPLYAMLANWMPTVQNKWLVSDILSCVVLVAHRALETRVASVLLEIFLIHLSRLLVFSLLFLDTILWLRICLGVAAHFWVFLLINY